MDWHRFLHDPTGHTLHRVGLDVLFYKVHTHNFEAVAIDPGGNHPSFSFIATGQNHNLVTLANFVHHLTPTAF